MLAIRWVDRKPVLMLSTVHEGKIVEMDKRKRGTEENVKKPDAILDYNINMRLVDKCDMQIGEIDCVRKSVKWYKKVFFHLMDMCVLNAYNLYLVKTGKRPSLRIFSQNVIKQLLARHATIPTPRQRHVPPSTPGRMLFQDAFNRHRLEELPGRQRRRCQVCFATKKVEKRSYYRCAGCDVGLCPAPCFTDYHTKRFFGEFEE